MWLPIRARLGWWSITSLRVARLIPGICRSWRRPARMARRDLRAALVPRVALASQERRVARARRAEPARPDARARLAEPARPNLHERRGRPDRLALLNSRE